MLSKNLESRINDLYSYLYALIMRNVEKQGNFIELDDNADDAIFCTREPESDSTYCLIILGIRIHESPSKPYLQICTCPIFYYNSDDKNALLNSPTSWIDIDDVSYSYNRNVLDTLNRYLEKYTSEKNSKVATIFNP